jgi:hypothetical protein
MSSIYSIEVEWRGETATITFVIIVEWVVVHARRRKCV